MSDFPQSEPVDHPNSCGLVRFNCHMATQTEVVQKLNAVPCLLLLPSTQLPLRTLKARTPIVLDHALTNWPLHNAIPPTVDFSRGVAIQHSLASPNTSTLLSNWVLGCLQVIRGYLIVCRATLVRAVRSCVRGEAIFRINSFTEYKRSGLSMARKIEFRRYTISFNSCPVRRSSSSLTPSGGSCHFAVPRNSLIWLASGPPTSSIQDSVNPKGFKCVETGLGQK